MKTLKFIILFSMFFMTKTFAQQASKAEIQVTGLTCSMCSQATEKSIRTLKYVADVKPDLNRNLFVVDFKDGSAVNFDQISAKVKDAGFSVGKLDATINFNQVKIDEKGQALIGSQVYQFTNASNKTLNGPTKVSFLDKNFLSPSAFKKMSSSVKAESYASGKGSYKGKTTRIYHVTLG